MNDVSHLRAASVEVVGPLYAGAWLGVLWSLVTMVTSLVWDLDASWYGRDAVSLPVLLLRIALYWPAWVTVQLAERLEWTGLDLGILWGVVVIIVGAISEACIGLACSWIARRRVANAVDRTSYPR